MTKIKLTKEQEDFLYINGHIIQEGNNTWFHMPYWIKQDENGEFEIVQFDKIPDSLIKEIQIRRDVIAKIPDHIKNKPMTYNELTKDSNNISE